MQNRRQRRRHWRRIRADKNLYAAHVNRVVAYGVAALAVALLAYEQISAADVVSILICWVMVGAALAGLGMARFQFARTLAEDADPDEGPARVPSDDGTSGETVRIEPLRAPGVEDTVRLRLDQVVPGHEEMITMITRGSNEESTNSG